MSSNSRTESEGMPQKKKQKGGRPKLEELLSKLLPEGEVLSLTTLAAIQVPDVEAAADDIHGVLETQESLFERHVGKRNDILSCALKFAQKELNKAAEVFNSNQRGGMGLHPDELSDNNHPMNNTIEGPKVEAKVWLEMFLGSEKYNQRMEGVNAMNDDGAGDDDDNPREVLIYNAFKDEIPELPMLDLLANSLEYLRQKADQGTSMEDLLRFTVVYGLDGALEDVLTGYYGTNALTVDSPLPLDGEPLVLDDFFRNRRLWLPAYGLAAILGHTHVIQKALGPLNGKVNCPLAWEMVRENELHFSSVDHRTPSEVLLWLIMRNQQKSLRCLVSDCGFQFRWIRQGRERTLLFNRIFHTTEYENSANWKGNLNEDDLMWESSRDRRRMRSMATYKEQMKMLDLMIELGMPFQFFFPVEPNIALEDRLREENKLNTREDCKAFKKMVSSEEWKARDKVWEAACEYNQTRENGNGSLENLTDYYRMLKAKWEGQANRQDVRLAEYEALDSSWQNQQVDQTQDDDDDDDGSMDGSSYGEY